MIDAARLRRRAKAAVDAAVKAEIARLEEKMRPSMAYCSAMYHYTDRPPWNYGPRCDESDE